MFLNLICDVTRWAGFGTPIGWFSIFGLTVFNLSFNHFLILHLSVYKNDDWSNKTKNYNEFFNNSSILAYLNLELWIQHSCKIIRWFAIVLFLDKRFFRCFHSESLHKPVGYYFGIKLHHHISTPAADYFNLFISQMRITVLFPTENGRNKIRKQCTMRIDWIK